MRTAAARALWVLVGGIVVLLLLQATTETYSPDSWSYVDLARTVLDGHPGQIHGIRDYTDAVGVNDSFPFLWPVVLTPGIAAVGADAPVGAWVFGLLWLLTCVVLTRLARGLGGAGWVGPAAGLGLLALPGYLPEGLAGRSMPLAVLLAVAAVAVLLLRPDRPVLAGLLLGLLAATRFDAAVLGPIIVVAALLLRRWDLRSGLKAGAAWAVGPALWAAYSLARLHGLYVTDNGRVLTSPTSTFATDWPPAVGRGVSGDLLSKAVDNLGPLGTGLGRAFSPLVLVAVVPPLVLLALLLRGRRPGRPGGAALVPVLVVVPVAVVQACLVLATGYADLRYWCLTATLLLLTALIVALGDGVGAVVARATLATLLVLGVVALTDRPPGGPGQGRLDAGLRDCLQGLDGTAIVQGNASFRLAATWRVRVATPPANLERLTRHDWEQLAGSYRITSWVLTGARGERALPPAARGVLAEARCPSSGSLWPSPGA